MNPDPVLERSEFPDGGRLPLRSFRLWVSTTPVGALIATIAVILVPEFLTAWWLGEGGAGTEFREVAADSVLHLAIVLPFLYFLFFLPRALTERALRAARDELELRVRERTAELEESNRRLRLEMEERAGAEEALRYSEEKYSTLVERSPTGIFLVKDGRLAFVNPKLADLLEYSREELLDLEPPGLVHPEDRECVREIGRKRQAGDAVPESYECRLLTKTGESRWVTMNNTLVPYRGGVVTLGNAQDVTERRKAEQALRASKEELRRLSVRILSAQEAERARIARELHDSLGQSLSAVKFSMEGALGGARSDERRSQATALRGLVPMMQGAVDEVRRISMALRPSTLDDLGLLATIAWFCREFEVTHPEVSVERDLEVAEAEIPDLLKTAIYRILQEAMNNVAKHSGAERVLLTLRKAGGTLELTVRDNGRGVDPGGTPEEGAVGGFGLKSMRERAELSGGEFRLESAPGQGTVVGAAWPLGKRDS